MKICGIIAEYNPFHLGHLKQIEYVKNVLGAEKIVVIMSGNFSQRGEVAVLDKFLRAFRAKIKVMETVGQGVNYYAYSTKIPYNQRVKGKTVNLQIFMGETTVKVGTPMIYGSF